MFSLTVDYVDSAHRKIGMAVPTKSISNDRRIIVATIVVVITILTY